MIIRDYVFVFEVWLIKMVREILKIKKSGLSRRICLVFNCF